MLSTMSMVLNPTYYMVVFRRHFGHGESSSRNSSTCPLTIVVTLVLYIDTPFFFTHFRHRPPPSPLIECGKGHDI